MVKVTFQDGTVVEYPNAAGYSDSPDGVSCYINDANGNAVAIIPSFEIKGHPEVIQ